MKHDLVSLKAMLAAAPAVKVKARLVRIVPHLELGPSPDWLFTSGKPNRYNPAGLNCVYFAEAREVAQAEYDNYWRGTSGENQPVTSYYGEVTLHRVLDLTDVATMHALKVDAGLLLKNWRGAGRKTLTQLLGQGHPRSVAQAAKFILPAWKSAHELDFEEMLCQTESPLAV